MSRVVAAGTARGVAVDMHALDAREGILSRGLVWRWPGYGLGASGQALQEALQLSSM